MDDRPRATDRTPAITLERRPDAVTLLERIATELNRAGIRFALIGAGALAVHGVSRSTLDHDLLVTDDRALDPALWHGISSDVVVDIRKGEADDPLAGAVRFQAAAERDVDLVVGRHAWQTDILTRAVRIRTTDGEIPVVTPGDLILLKLYAGGIQDKWDIEQLLASADRRLLALEVESRLDSLPPRCRDLWKRSFRGWQPDQV